MKMVIPKIFIAALLTVLIFGFAVTANEANAQTCTGTGSCCEVSEIIYDPPGCREPECRTRVCAEPIINGLTCSFGGAGCGIYDCWGEGWVTSSSCTVTYPTDPDPDPDPEPDPGGLCGGGSNPQCVAASNCGVVGKVSGSGTCPSGQICCVDGGGGGAACSVEFPDGINTLAVGQTAQLTAFARGGSQWWDGIWGWTNGSSVLGTFNPWWHSLGATYITTFTATTPGISTMRFRVIADNDPNTVYCEGTRVFRVVNSPTPTAWAQILNGDLMTFGRISMTIPSGQFLVGREGSDEGIITHTTTNVPTAQVSQRGWNVSNSPLSRPLRYADLFEQVPLTPRQINGAINTSSLNPSPAQPDAFGYEWFLYSGNNAIIPNGLTISSGRKVVLFVPGDVAINGNITIDDMSNSFFMLVSSGNITVNNPVGRNASETAPSLDGIYVSDGVFGTSRSVGANNNRVNVRGTVVALGGVNLQRDTQTAFPSETFSFAPELILNFPPSLSTKRAFWKEITP